MRRSEQLALAALALSIAWTGWDVSRPAKTFAIGGPAGLPARRPAPPGDDAYADVVRRSLFVPARQAGFGSVAVRPGMIGGHVLRGVVSGAGGGIAVFEPIGGGPARRLRIGSSIGGYRIAAVEDGAILLERAEGRRRIAIDQTASVAPGATPPPALSALAPAAAAPPPVELTPDEIEQ